MFLVKNFNGKLIGYILAARVLLFFLPLSLWCSNEKNHRAPRSVSRPRPLFVSQNKKVISQFFFDKTKYHQAVKMNEVVPEFSLSDLFEVSRTTAQKVQLFLKDYCYFKQCVKLGDFEGDTSLSKGDFFRWRNKFRPQRRGDESLCPLFLVSVKRYTGKEPTGDSVGEFLFNSYINLLVNLESPYSLYLPEDHEKYSIGLIKKRLKDTIFVVTEAISYYCFSKSISTKKSYKNLALECIWASLHSHLDCDREYGLKHLVSFMPERELPDNERKVYKLCVDSLINVSRVLLQKNPKLIHSGYNDVGSKENVAYFGQSGFYLPQSYFTPLFQFYMNSGRLFHVDDSSENNIAVKDLSKELLVNDKDGCRKVFTKDRKKNMKIRKEWLVKKYDINGTFSLPQAYQDVKIVCHEY